MQSLYERGSRTDLKGASAAVDDGRSIANSLHSSTSNFDRTGKLSPKEQEQIFNAMDRRSDKAMMDHMQTYANGNGRYNLELSRQYDPAGKATEMIQTVDKGGKVVNTYKRQRSTD